MKPSPIDTLTDTLDKIDVQWSLASAETFTRTLSDVVKEPVVGSPLPFSGLSLPDPPVILDPTAAQLEQAATGVTAVELAVASYGTLVIRQHGDWTEAISLFPRFHVAVLRASDVVPDMTSAFEWLGGALSERPTSVVLATGPSATADMGSLVRGAHGPEQVHVIILNDL